MRSQDVSNERRMRGSWFPRVGEIKVKARG